MPKTVQIRNIDDETYAGLRRRAGAVGMTIPEFLRRELARIAQQPSMEEWMDRVRRRPPTPGTVEDVIAALDEIRGPWPDADR